MDDFLTDQYPDSYEIYQETLQTSQKKEIQPKVAVENKNELDDYIIEECIINEKNEKIDEIITPKISNIEKQKTVALELLETLREKYPFSIIAGGAPRDWDNNIEATDIDFWILPLDYLSVDTLEELINLRLTQPNSEEDELKAKEYIISTNQPNYESIPIVIDKVYKTEYKNVNIDLIIMKSNKVDISSIIKTTEDYRKVIYNRFDFGLCMNSYEPDGFHPDDRYTKDKNEKTITLYMDNVFSFSSLQHIIVKHIKKLIIKHPEHSVKINISDRMNQCFEQIYKNYFYMNTEYKGENNQDVPF